MSVSDRFRRLAGLGDYQTSVQARHDFICSLLHEHRMVIVLADVTQNYSRSARIEIASQKLADGLIGKMPHATHYTLLHRPWIWPDLQHI